MEVTGDQFVMGGQQPTFERDLESLLNRYSKENGSNTPDFILAEFIRGCVLAWDRGVTHRDKWYGVNLRPGQVSTNAETHLRMQIGYLVAELQEAGDKRTTPEIVETAAKVTAG